MASMRHESKKVNRTKTLRKYNNVHGYQVRKVRGSPQNKIPTWCETNTYVNEMIYISKPTILMAILKYIFGSISV